MKKLFLILLLTSIIPVFAEENIKPAVNQPLTVAQNILFEDCTKIFKINQEDLFYLTLGAVSANRFTIDEKQTVTLFLPQIKTNIWLPPQK